MAQGITFATDRRGDVIVTFNLNKYAKKLMDIFKSEGIDEKAESYLVQSDRLKKAIRESESRSLKEYHSKEEFLKDLGL